MKLPKISEDGKDWLRIFGVLFILIWACALSQSMREPAHPIYVELHVDDKTR